jgi:hypothetical protein
MLSSVQQSILKGCLVSDTFPSFKWSESFSFHWYYSPVSAGGISTSDLS